MPTRVLRALTVLGAAVLLAAVGLVRAQDADWNDREKAAIGALRQINVQEILFRDGDKEEDGNNDYGMLSELSNTGLIDAVLGSGTKNGYIFQAAYSPTTSEFLWWGMATPTHEGDHYFFVNTSGQILAGTAAPKIDRELCRIDVPKDGFTRVEPSGRRSAAPSTGFLNDWRHLAGKGSNEETA